MLHIIRQYKQLFSWLMANSFTERTDFKAKEFNNLDENARNEFVKRNISMIKKYVSWLDKARDWLIASNYSNKSIDDFSWTNLSENITNEQAFKNILKSVWLDTYNLNEWVNLSEVIGLLDSFKTEKIAILKDTKSEKNLLNRDTNNIWEWNEKQFLANISNSRVKPTKWELFWYEEDGRYVLEIDDYVFIWTDPTYTFNKVPTTKEIETVVTNFNKSINISEWDNLPSDMVDKRLDNAKVGKNSAKLKDNKSKEVLPSSKSAVLWMEFLRTDSDSNEYLEDNQLKKLLQKDSNELKQIIKEIQNVLWTKWKFKFVNYKIWSNYSDMYPILEKYWYEVPMLWLDDKEASNIYTALLSYVKNQKEVASKLSPEEKMKMLLDFNKDWSLTTWMDKASIWEAQALYKILESPSSDWYEATIKNLWFSSSKELFAKMETNLFSTREAFQDAIKSALKTWELSILTRTDAPAKMWVELMRRNAEMQKEINRNVDLWFNRGHDVSNLKYIWNVKRETFIEQIKSLITPNSLWFWVLDDQKMKDLSAWGGLWYNINLQNITYWLLDSFSLWFTDKWAGWAISKDLLAPFRNFMHGYKASLTVALANGMPMVSASAAVIDQANVKLNSLSQQDMDTKTTVSLGWSVWPGFIGWNVNAIFRNENTVVWIEEMTNSYQDRLYKNKAYILRWATFDVSGFKTKDSTDYDKQMYGLIVNMFKTETAKIPDSQKAEYLDKLFLPRFVQAYKDNLYKNKDGSFDISSVTAWAIILPGTLIPFIVAGWEYKYQNIKETNRNIDIQEQVNYKEMPASTVWLKVDNLNGKKVFKIPASFTTKDWNIWRYQISSSLENQQVVIKGWYIYIWWDISSSDITFLDHVSSKDVTRTIVIWKWIKETDKDSENYGLYLPTKISWNISSWVKVNEVKDVAEKLGTDTESFNEVAWVTNILNNLISRDILSDKRTVWMTDLQRNIFSFSKNGTPSLDLVYWKYLNAISYKWFKNYVVKKSWLWDLAEGKVNDLISQSNKPGLSDSAKVFILQSMVNNFMKSNKFNYSDNWNIQLEKGSIKNYDKSRDVIFDKMMQNELWSSMSEKVKVAKYNWMSNFWKNKNFEAVPTWQWTLWLTTNAYKKNVNGLLPLSWMFNVVWFGWKPAAEKILWMTIEDKKSVLKSVGNNILKSYSSQLNAHGYNFNENTVVDFIANWWDQNAKVDMNTFFVKNWECINDCIIVNLNLNIKWKQVPLTIWSTWTTSVWIVENKSINIGWAYARTIDTEDRDEDKKEDKSEDKQEDKNPTPPDTKPWNGDWNPPPDDGNIDPIPTPPKDDDWWR